MPDPGDQPPATRLAARVLLVDSANRVLLYRGFDPAVPERRYWFTVGGAIDPGESAAQAAARELAEEAGLVVAAGDLGEPVLKDITEFSFNRRQYRQHQDFYLYKVDRHEVSTDGFDSWERDTIDQHRWWTIEELEATTEPVYPPTLAATLRQLLEVS